MNKHFDLDNLQKKGEKNVGIPYYLTIFLQRQNSSLALVKSITCNINSFKKQKDAY